MNFNSKVKEKININNDSNNDISSKVITSQEAGILENVNMPFSGLLAQQMEGENSNLINSDLSLMNIDFNYDSLTMSLDDAKFFVNLTKEGQFSVNSNQNGDFQSLVQLEIGKNIVSQRSVEVTNQLTKLIEKAQSTQKPVRISFDNDVSVILRIDKHGKVTAEFIPGNIEVENYLRNNIASLRQKFDEQNLPYNDLFYRQNGKQNRNKNKEKGEE